MQKKATLNSFFVLFTINFEKPSAIFVISIPPAEENKGCIKLRGVLISLWGFLLLNEFAEFCPSNEIKKYVENEIKKL